MAPRALTYPKPRVVLPLSGVHKQTFILLHGRGSSVNKFEPPLLAAPIPDAQTKDSDSPLTLTTAFPDAKFIFPTAPKGRATIYKRSVIRQWFDDWHLDHTAEHDEMQISGLTETVVFLHDLIRKEVSLVPGGANNVILGGFSQGCATSLVSMLLWDGEPLGAVVGMCGWLPYRKHLEDIVRTGGVGVDDGFTSSPGPDFDDFDPFERSSSPEPKLEPRYSHPDRPNSIDSALEWLAEELQIPKKHPVSSTALQETPIFLGHGTEDEKVCIGRGHECSQFLPSLGMAVSLE